MARYFKINLRNSSRDLLVLSLVFALFAFAVGVGVMLLIAAEDDENTFFCCGTLMVFVLSIFSAALLHGTVFRSDFNLALSMGDTRKGFLISRTIVEIILFAVLYGVMRILNVIERTIYVHILPGYTEENLIGFINDWRAAAAFVIICTVIALFVGTLYMRWGRKGIWWLFLCPVAFCIGFPRLAESGFLEKIPQEVSFSAAGALILAMIIFIIVVTPKQKVSM